MRKFLHRIICLAVLIIAHTSHAKCIQSGISGLWDTIDDRTGQKKALVLLKENDGKVVGQIKKVYWKKGDHKICIYCRGENKNKPIEGLTFLWDLRKESPGHWIGGSILDPHDGHVYQANIKKQGEQLFVRAYLGLSFLGRTQVWHCHPKEIK